MDQDVVQKISDYGTAALDLLLAVGVHHFRGAIGSVDYQSSFVNRGSCLQEAFYDTGKVDDPAVRLLWVVELGIATIPESIRCIDGRDLFFRRLINDFLINASIVALAKGRVNTAKKEILGENIQAHVIESAFSFVLLEA